MGGGGFLGEIRCQLHGLELTLCFCLSVSVSKGGSLGENQVSAPWVELSVFLSLLSIQC